MHFRFIDENVLFKKKCKYVFWMLQKEVGCWTYFYFLTAWKEQIVEITDYCSLLYLFWSKSFLTKWTAYVVTDQTFD